MINLGYVALGHELTTSVGVESRAPDLHRWGF
jgi:hypothetical protein